MLLDFDGLILILAHVVLSSSFPSNRLVHGAVMVRVVMSAMLALIGVNRTLDFCRSPPATHFEALIITSIAIMWW